MIAKILKKRACYLRIRRIEGGVIITEILRNLCLLGGEKLGPVNRLKTAALLRVQLRQYP